MNFPAIVVLVVAKSSIRNILQSRGPQDARSSEIVQLTEYGYMPIYPPAPFFLANQEGPPTPLEASLSLREARHQGGRSELGYRSAFH